MLRSRYFRSPPGANLADNEIYPTPVLFPKLTACAETQTLLSDEARKLRTPDEKPTRGGPEPDG